MRKISKRVVKRAEVAWLWLSYAGLVAFFFDMGLLPSISGFFAVVIFGCLPLGITAVALDWIET